MIKAELVGIVLFVIGIFTLNITKITIGALLFFIPFFYGYFKDLAKKKNILKDDKLFSLYYNFNEYLEGYKGAISTFNKKQLIAYTFVFSGMIFSSKERYALNDNEFIELFSAVLSDKQYILGLRDADVDILPKLVLCKEKLGPPLKHLIEVGVEFAKEDSVLNPIDNNIFNMIEQVAEDESFPESFDQIIL